MKRKRKKRRKEKKRSEEKKVVFGIGLGTFDAPGQRSSTTWPRGTLGKHYRNFIIKTFEPLLNVNSKIPSRRMTVVSTVKTQRKCISSHFHVKNGSPTV